VPKPTSTNPPAAQAIEHLPTARLKPYANNARTHSKAQLRQIARSIERFGFTNPVLVSDDNEIIAGHGRVEAAKLIGRSEVPVLRLSHLSAAERRAYVIADNKLALEAGWDKALLASELQGLVDLGFEVELTGFSLAEIDLVIDTDADSKPVLCSNLTQKRSGERKFQGITSDIRKRPPRI